MDIGERIELVRARGMSLGHAFTAVTDLLEIHAPAPAKAECPFDYAPYKFRVGAFIVVDEDVSQRAHLAPRDLGIGIPKSLSDLPGCLANDLEITADGAEEDGTRNTGLFAQALALDQLFATIPNVKEIDLGIGKTGRH